LIATRLAIKTANTHTRKDLGHPNSAEIQYFGTFSAQLDQRFLLSDTDFRSVAGHPAPTSSGLALNRPIPSRISRNTRNTKILTEPYIHKPLLILLLLCPTPTRRPASSVFSPGLWPGVQT